MDCLVEYYYIDGFVKYYVYQRGGVVVETMGSGANLSEPSETALQTIGQTMGLTVVGRRLISR